MNTQVIFYYALAALVGMLGGIHIPMNGGLGAKLGSPWVATFIFYGIAFLLIGVFTLVIHREPEAWRGITSMPRWYFLAGVISVIVVGGSTYLIPRIGAVNLFVVVLAIQMQARMVISHFGWLESPISEITLYKLVGALLLMVGALLVVKG